MTSGGLLRSPIKFAVPVVVAALALSACGTKGGDTTSSGGSSGAASLRPQDRLFGALTGDDANLGINIQNGVKLAVDEYNEKNADCKVTLENFDSQGDPDQAPGLAKKAIDDKKLVGIVGPAFSGESKAADPVFDEAGLVDHHRLGDQPGAVRQRLEDLPPRPRQRRHPGPGRREVHQGHPQGQEGFVIDDASEYGKGLADIVRKDLGARSSATTRSSRSRPTSAATVTKVKASGADAVFFGGYYAEAAPLVKQLRDAGWKGTFVAGRRRQGPRLHRGRRRGRRGRDLTCPCAPADAAPEFAAAYKKAYNRDPAPTRLRATTPRTSCSTASRPARRPREHDRLRRSPTTRRASPSSSSSTTRASRGRSHVCAYKVEDGKIVAGQRDQVAPTSIVTGWRSWRSTPDRLSTAAGALAAPRPAGPRRSECSS